MIKMIMLEKEGNPRASLIPRRGCSAHQLAGLLLLWRQQEQCCSRWACGDRCLHNQPESPSPCGSVAGDCLASQKSLWFTFLAPASV